MRHIGLAAAALATVLAGCNCGEPAVAFGLPDADYWPDMRNFPCVTSGAIYITNNFSDTVSVLDIDTFDVIATVPVGLIPVEREGPHHVAVANDGLHYFVGISNFAPGSGSGPHGAHGAGTADGHALKLETCTNALVDEVRVNPNPGDIRLTPDGRFLMMTHFDLLLVQRTFMMTPLPPAEDAWASLVIIDPETMTKLSDTPICLAPHGVLASADGTEAYAACNAGDEIAVIALDGKGGTILPVEHVKVAPDAGDPPLTPTFYDPYSVSINPTDGSVWIGCWGNGDIRVYDPATGAMDPTRTLSTNGLPNFGDFLDDGSLLVQPVAGIDRLLLIDPNTSPPDVLASLTPPDCIAPHAAFFLPGEEQVVLVCEGDHIEPGTVLRYDLASDTFDRTTTVGVFPDDAAILP